MDPFNAGEISPGPSVQTDEEILDWVRKALKQRYIHHAVRNGTCIRSNGSCEPTYNESSENLRVVDASAMPEQQTEIFMHQF